MNNDYGYRLALIREMIQYAIDEIEKHPERARVVMANAIEDMKNSAQDLEDHFDLEDPSDF